MDEEIEKCRGDIKELANQIEQMNIIHIQNGNGRKIMFRRPEFYQMIYDKTIFRWKDYAKDIVIILSVLTNLALALKAFGVFH
jgi:hypothetical protein